LACRRPASSPVGLRKTLDTAGPRIEIWTKHPSAIIGWTNRSLVVIEHFTIPVIETAVEGSGARAAGAANHRIRATEEPVPRSECQPQDPRDLGRLLTPLLTLTSTSRRGTDSYPLLEVHRYVRTRRRIHCLTRRSRTLIALEPFDDRVDLGPLGAAIPGSRFQPEARSRGPAPRRIIGDGHHRRNRAF